MNTKPLTPNDIRNKLLKERGITRTSPERHKRKKFLPANRFTISHKTPKMMYLEMKYNKRIEDILISGSLSSIVRAYGGELSPSTVSKWIKRFKVRYSVSNLPMCEECRHVHESCTYPSFQCSILVMLGLYILVPLKRAQLEKESV